MNDEATTPSLMVGMRVTERGFGVVGEILGAADSPGEWRIRDRYGRVVIRRAEDLQPWELDPRGSFRPPVRLQGLRSCLFGAATGQHTSLATRRRDPESPGYRKSAPR